MSNDTSSPDSGTDAPIVKRSSSTQLKDYGTTKADLEQENFDLIAKVIFLIDTIGWSEDNTFTFPDGETWGRLETDDEDS